MTTDATKIKFINYEIPTDVTHNSKTQNSSSASHNDVTTSEYKCEKETTPLPEIKNMSISQKHQPKFLINVFNLKNPNTDYTNTIHHPKLKNALFIYLSNEKNSGYAGGGESGTATIGDKENTFGIITGHYDSSSLIKTGGFQKLDDKQTFKLCHRLDAKTYNMTPKQSIDYLLGQLSELIQNKKYEYIILPCDLIDDKSNTFDYKNYTIGAKIFNTAPEVKNYIYNGIVNMTTAKEGGMILITDFLK